MNPIQTIRRFVRRSYFGTLNRKPGSSRKMTRLCGERLEERRLMAATPFSTLNQFAANTFSSDLVSNASAYVFSPGAASNALAEPTAGAAVRATFDVSSGMLQVVGTLWNDKVKVVESEGRVSVEVFSGINHPLLPLARYTPISIETQQGQALSIGASSLRKVRVYGLQGADTLGFEYNNAPTSRFGNMLLNPERLPSHLVVELFGGDGDDVLTVVNGGHRSGGGWFSGGDGSPRFSPVTLYGGAGDDRLTGSIGDETLRGGDGHDTLIGGAGNDWLYGDDGRDTLFGDHDSDTQGGGGHDHLYGGAHSDKLYGDGGANSWGGTGNDRLFGGGGDDTIFGHGGDDYLVGEAGNDFLYGNAGTDTLYGDQDPAAGGFPLYIGHDELYGGSGNDRLYGQHGDDYLDGEWGSDHIYGGAGADTLIGGPGRDGEDRLYGQGDGDVFYITYGRKYQPSGATGYTYSTTDDIASDYNPSLGDTMVAVGWEPATEPGSVNYGGGDTPVPDYPAPSPPSMPGKPPKDEKKKEQNKQPAGSGSASAWTVFDEIAAATIASTIDAVALNPQPLPPKDVYFGGLASELNQVALNPQPLPPKDSYVDVVATGSAVDMVMLNPQPLPPKVVAPYSATVVRPFRLPSVGLLSR